jgi:hypothetical protein
VVENGIGVVKKFRILHKYRHFNSRRAAAGRARLGRVVRVVAALVNWRSSVRAAGGKQRRRSGWQPTANKTYLRKLLTEAEKIGGKELQRFNDLLEGRKTPSELGLLGQRLTAEEEALLVQKGDTTETWETIEEVKGVVTQLSSEGNLRIARVGSRAAAAAASAAAPPTATVTPARVATNGAKGKLVVSTK